MGFSTWYGKPVEEKEAIAVIHHAFNSGVTFFDTSDAYGPHSNEKLLGRVRQFPVLKAGLWQFGTHLVSFAFLPHLEAFDPENYFHT